MEINSLNAVQHAFKCLQSIKLNQLIGSLVAFFRLIARFEPRFPILISTNSNWIEGRCLNRDDVHPTRKHRHRPESTRGKIGAAVSRINSVYSVLMISLQAIFVHILIFDCSVCPCWLSELNYFRNLLMSRMQIESTKGEAKKFFSLGRILEVRHSFSDQIAFLNF